jgi:hypothetical protein
VKNLKKTYGVSLNPLQIKLAKKWANDHEVSFAAIFGAAIGILCEIPLNKREMEVETALRKALHAPPSNDAVQMERRVSKVETSLGDVVHRMEVAERALRNMHECVNGICKHASQNPFERQQQKRRVINQGGVVAKTAFINPPAAGSDHNK